MWRSNGALLAYPCRIAYLSELALLLSWECFERGVSGLYERLLYDGLLFARYPGRCAGQVMERVDRERQ